jgi:hypothetical protein
MPMACFNSCARARRAGREVGLLQLFGRLVLHVQRLSLDTIVYHQDGSDILERDLETLFWIVGIMRATPIVCKYRSVVGSYLTHTIFLTAIQQR